jgi:hypothetical protein
MLQKTCKCCQQTKDIEAFANAGTIKGISYKRNLCIPCYTLSKKPRKEKLRKDYYAWKQQLCCERCGYNDFRALQFHHKGDKEAEISNLLNKGFTLDKIKKEAEKCEVLCANCHQIEHFNGV